MLERLLLLALLFVSVVLAMNLARAALSARRRGLEGLVLSEMGAGVPTVIAFSTPDCAQCKRLQSPALQTLQAELGDTVRIMQVDAIERADLASTYKILTVPATVVLTSEGRVAAMNDGFAPAARLREQIARATLA